MALLPGCRPLPPMWGLRRPCDALRICHLPSVGGRELGHVHRHAVDTAGPRGALVKLSDLRASGPPPLRRAPVHRMALLSRCPGLP